MLPGVWETGNKHVQAHSPVQKKILRIIVPLGVRSRYNGQVLWRPEESVRFPGAGGTVGFEF